MRLLLDANILLDCEILEKNGLPRRGKAASEQILHLCNRDIHTGFIAWHTLSILSYYFRRQHNKEETGVMIDRLLLLLEVPTVRHREALAWRSAGITDFEDALQVMSARAGEADFIITRNVADFKGSLIPVMTPDDFLAAYP